MFERNLFQSRFAEFIASTYGKAAWIRVAVSCGDDSIDDFSDPDESNARCDQLSCGVVHNLT